MRTITAAAIGTKATAVENLATLGNSSTARSVNVKTPRTRKETAPVNAVKLTTNLMADVTTTTTIAAVIGMVVTVVGAAATRDSGFIALSASVKTRNSRRPTSVPVTRADVSIPHGSVMDGATI